MPNTRTEILIKKIVRSGFDLEDAENYFHINKKILNGDLVEFFKSQPQKLSKLFERIKINESLKLLELNESES